MLNNTQRKSRAELGTRFSYGVKGLARFGSMSHKDVVPTQLAYGRF